MRGVLTAVAGFVVGALIALGVLWMVYGPAWGTHYPRATARAWLAI